MRPTRLWLVVVLSSCLATFTLAQSTSSSSVQAVSVLQSAYKALSGATPINDVTLTGTAHRISGSDDFTGSVVLKAMAGGGSRVDLALSSGNISEITSISASGIAGAWSGDDGVQHPIAGHNLMSDPAWFFPLFALNRSLNSIQVAMVLVGPETLNGQPVIHVSVSELPDGVSGQAAVLPQHLSQMEFYLDPTTYLPVALSFMTHPDSNALLDIPVQIQFSSYQKVGGALIPMHVQKFLNNSLFLDLQLQAATLNSGLTASVFSVQVGQ